MVQLCHLVAAFFCATHTTKQILTCQSEKEAFDAWRRRGQKIAFLISVSQPKSLSRNLCCQGDQKWPFYFFKMAFFETIWLFVIDSIFGQ